MFSNIKIVIYHAKNFFTPFYFFRQKGGLKKLIFFFIPFFTLIACASGGIGPDKKPYNKRAEEILNQYIIQPGDTLLIDILENTNTSRRVPVRPDGKISLPQVNDIQAAGLTTLQLRENLLNEYKRFFSVVEVSVTVINITGYKITVVGNVNQSGQIMLHDKTTLLEAIALAGGFDEWAKPKKIYIIRKIDSKRGRINVNYDNILNGSEENIWVLPGDIIVVP